MIIVNLGLLVGLGLLHLANPVEFPESVIALETIVTFILLLEVLIRMFSQGTKQFFSSWCNIVDVAVVGMCIIISLLFVSLPNTNELEEAVADVLMGCRYGVHFIRVLMLLKLTRGKQPVLRNQRRSMDVTFTRLNSTEEGEHNFDDSVDDGEYGMESRYVGERGSEKDEFGMVYEMTAALGGFDDFDGYSKRITSMLDTGGVALGSSSTPPKSQFDMLYDKHVRYSSSPARKKMDSEKQRRKQRQQSDDEGEVEEEEEEEEEEAEAEAEAEDIIPFRHTG